MEKKREGGGETRKSSGTDIGVNCDGAESTTPREALIRSSTQF